jgi:DNA helicase-2/ATP-dependent DNA helicase PcrA
VAVANLVEGDFPGDSRGSSGWLGFGKLPYPLRGDKTSLPTWNYLAAQTQPEAKKSQEEFKAASRLNQLNEELRLMYVAVTRTKSDLLLTGSYWKPANKNPRTPSRYLVQTSELLALEIEELQSQANPLSEVESIESWPLDPLGEKHRLSVELAAAKTKTAIEQLADTQQALEYGDLVQLDINLLLAERDEAISRTRLTQLPVRVPASRFKDFVSDMANLAERSRRPMPQQPYKQTRTGTLFHSWVENRFSAQKLLETPISEDDSILLDSIQELQENFESSRFANLVPIEIEQEIQITVGANTFICKLDAVFATETGVEIIDWKTGAAPKDEADLALKTLQLALYRLAYSRYSGLPENQIEVGFYFVSQNLEVRPTHVPSSAEVLELWSKALET